MKFLIPLFLFLAACSKEGDSPAPLLSGPRTSQINLKVLEATNAYPTEEVHRALTNSMAAGTPLTPATAERCWQTETARRNIALECALAWSIGRERSPMLEKELAELAPQNRAAAVTAIRAEFPLEKLNNSMIRGLLHQINDDPPWLKAKAIWIWMRTAPSLSIGEREAIRSHVQIAKLRSPADFRFAYFALSELDPTAAAALLNAHCGPLSDGDVRVRCWRFLSAFVGPEAPHLPPALYARMPLRDHAWQLFQLEMPLRARFLTE